MSKIGFICIGHEDYVSKSSDDMAKRAVKELRNKGLEVVWKNATAVDSNSARQLARSILKEDVESIIIFMATWMECPVAMSVVREIEHLPFALWGTPMFENNGDMESTGSFVSFAMFKGSLDRLEYRFKSLLGSPDDEETIQVAFEFCNAASAYENLKRTSIGLVGYTSMSIYPGTFDHLLMRKIIGPEIVQMDTYTVIEHMKKRSLKASMEKLIITRSKLSQEAGVIGAASLVFNKKEL